MNNIYNAVDMCVEELELEGYLIPSVREIAIDQLYHVTFQHAQNGNKKVVISVEYSNEIGDLATDEGWESETVNLIVLENHGMNYTTSEVIREALEMSINPDAFESESEEEEESDDETESIGSQPLTPPPSQEQQD